MNRGAEFKVGLTVLVAFAILIGGVVFLKEMSLHNAKRVYRVMFTQTGGLAESDEVQVNGIRKGQVGRLKLEGDHVLVDVELSRDVVVTHDSRVVIRNVGMMGEKVVAVDLKASGTPYREGEIIQGVYEPGLGDLMGQVGTTVDAVVQLSEQLRQVAVSLQRGGKLESTISNFNSTSEELRLAVSENRAQLNETLRNFNAASRTAKGLTADREVELRQALDSFTSAANRLDLLTNRLDSLSTVANRIVQNVDAGHGTIGRLVQDERLYDEMRSSIASMKALIEDVKKNPKRYFKFSVF